MFNGCETGSAFKKSSEGADLPQRIERLEETVYEGAFSVSLLKEVLSLKADDDRDDIRSRKSRLVFSLFENYRDLLLERSASESLGLIEDVLEMVFYKETDIKEYSERKGFVIWSIRRLTACSKVEPAINLAVRIAEEYPYDSFDRGFLLHVFRKDVGFSQQRFLQLISEKRESISVSTMTIFADLVGAEEARKAIDQRILENKDNQSVRDNFQLARSYLTPNHDKQAILDLKEFYENKIKFSEYSLNDKMTPVEVALLETLLDKKEEVLEHGCGSGRLIARLAEAGYNIEGFDFTPQHIKDTLKELKERNCEAEVFEGDWHNIERIGEGSKDVVYSFGRNLLHDYSIVDQTQSFREAARVLKKGGRFIFDIPDRDKGGYAEMVKGYANEMKRRGMRNFRYGTIYDSPNGEHFATRYAYSHEDIEELARLAGFKIVKIEKLPLETGQGDENLYYVLRKIQ